MVGSGSGGINKGDEILLMKAVTWQKEETMRLMFTSVLSKISVSGRRYHNTEILLFVLKQGPLKSIKKNYHSAACYCSGL